MIDILTKVQESDSDVQKNGPLTKCGATTLKKCDDVFSMVFRPLTPNFEQDNTLYYKIISHGRV